MFFGTFSLYFFENEILHCDYFFGEIFSGDRMMAFGSPISVLTRRDYHFKWFDLLAIFLFIRQKILTSNAKIQTCRSHCRWQTKNFLPSCKNIATSHFVQTIRYAMMRNIFLAPCGFVWTLCACSLNIHVRQDNQFNQLMEGTPLNCGR